MNEARPIRTAEILCVGTELLLGDIVNTNAAYLSARLAELGIHVYRHTVVGDNPERLSRALKAAFEEADLVITSGGLGPTYDDLTKETVAAYFGLPLELHEASLDAIRSYFTRTGRVMTKNNEKQAMMPRGAHVFPNHYGTAPSLAIANEEGTKTAIMLPGPPGELCPIFEEEILPYLKSRRTSVLVSKNIHIFGMGESAVEERLKELMTKATNPTVAPYCKEGEVRLRVTAEGDSEAEASAMCDDMIAQICRTEVGQYVYGMDVGTLEQAVILFLRSRGLTLACAESCTGGLIAKRITDIAGCSDVFLGGCVTYANEAKIRLLGVREETLARHGAVSEQTAREMARGVRERLGADIGVSATGIAGPGGGSKEKPVGTVYVGISTKDGEQVRRLSLSSMRSRDYIRIVSAGNAYDMILHCDK
ncbi:MAG: competence/damage-inducible protein A [Ruminococcaceae bacterium]|nr:competence/damage-inducible protein A [Oscillospiraceae bacterium]